jgi:hypothetical protein
MGVLGDKRKERYDKRREAKLNAKEARRQYRQEMRNRLNKFAEGGTVYPVRFKYNRRILLLTRLR